MLICGVFQAMPLIIAHVTAFFLIWAGISFASPTVPSKLLQVEKWPNKNILIDWKYFLFN